MISNGAKLINIVSKNDFFCFFCKKEVFSQEY